MTVTELKPESVWFAFVDLGVSNLTEELKLHLQNFSAFTLSNSLKKQFYGLINEMEAFQGNWITGNQELHSTSKFIQKNKKGQLHLDPTIVKYLNNEWKYLLWTLNKIKRCASKTADVTCVLCSFFQSLQLFTLK